MSTELTDLDPMPFGKHKGTPMQDVPVSYLHWLWNIGCDPRVMRYIDSNLDALRMENEDLIWDKR